MNIHEYQAKEVLKGFGLPVPRGIPAFSPDEAVKAAETLGGSLWVVKAQIHAGGRGKAGGVKVVKSLDDVRKEAARMLGSVLVTHQTGPPSCRAALTASSTLNAGKPRGTGTPNEASTALAWYS